MTMCLHPTDDARRSTLIAPRSMLRPARANTGVKATERTRKPRAKPWFIGSSWQRSAIGRKELTPSIPPEPLLSP